MGEIILERGRKEVRSKLKNFKLKKKIFQFSKQKNEICQLETKFFISFILNFFHYKRKKSCHFDFFGENFVFQKCC